MDFVAALKLCQQGLDVWKSQEHNYKWWRRIDGTPIPNDLLVCIAEAIRDAVQTDSAQGHPSDLAVLESSARGIEGYARQIGVALNIYRCAFETMQESVKEADPYLRGERPTDSVQGQAVAWRTAGIGEKPDCVECGHVCAPPSAPEPVAWLPEDDYERQLFDRTTSDLYKGNPIAQVLHSLRIWATTNHGSMAHMCAVMHNEIAKALAAAPLPSAGRPVTPCTREDAVEIAKRAEVITPDIENAAVQGSKHFWVAGVIELMRLIDAARGVS